MGKVSEGYVWDTYAGARDDEDPCMGEMRTVTLSIALQHSGDWFGAKNLTKRFL